MAEPSDRLATPRLAPGESTFGSYAAFLVRQRVLVIGAVLAGILAALGVLVLGPKTYAATTEVLVLSQAARQPSDGPAMVNLDDEAQLLTSTDVLDDAARRIGAGTDPREVEQAIVLSVAANTTVLSITYRAPTAADAQRGADAVAAAYLDQRRAQAQARLDTALDWLAREQADVERQLQEVLLRLGTDGERATDQADRAVLSARLARLRAQLPETAASVPLGGRVISPAARPSAPKTPIPTLVGISGILAGLLVGCALGGLREYLSPRIRTPDDITRRLGAPVLTVVDAATAAMDLSRLATLVADEADRPTEPVRCFLLAATTPRVRGLAEALVRAIRDTGREARLVQPEERPAELVGASSGGPAAGGPPRSWDDEAEAAAERGEIVLIERPADDAGALPPMLAEGLLVVVEFGRTRPDDLARAVAHLRRDHHRLVGILGVRPARFGRALWEVSS